MNAVEYFKKNGLSKSKTHLDKMDAEEWHNEFYRELKQIVEAFELVESWGGLEDAKLYDLSHCESKPESMGCKLMKAINLVEQCNA